MDHVLGEVLAAVEAAGWSALVTADHGNAECLLQPDGSPHTAHTTNLVPCWLVGAPGRLLRDEGELKDVAPTLLALLGLEPPPAMSGKDLRE